VRSVAHDGFTVHFKYTLGSRDIGTARRFVEGEESPGLAIGLDCVGIFAELSRTRGQGKRLQRPTG
jgi:hypothetical protein